jgi:hypothetical protein
MTRRHTRTPSIIVAIIGSVIILAGLPPAPVHAQSGSGIAGQNTVAPAGRAPSVTQETPVEPTAEQLRMREEGMRRSNPPGPPLPVTPGAAPRQTPIGPATQPKGTPRSQAPADPNSQSDAPQAAPPAPGDMIYYLTHDQAAFYSGGKGVTNEPSVGNAGPIVFVTSNWDAAYSTNAGSTFTFVNPYTTFPSIDGGFCCDQTAIYASAQDAMIWQLQYIYSAMTGKNTYRIAFAPANSVAFSGWCYYDFNPAFFGVQNPGAKFDYPDVSLSNNYVWYQTRIFSDNGFVGTLIFRIHIAEAVACQNTSVDWVITDSSHFTVSLAKGAQSTMYFFVHNGTSSERVYTWAEGTLNYSWNDFNVSTWADAARSCPWPIATGGDGRNWCGGQNNPNNISRTSWVSGGVIGTMWGASQDGSHPFPYIRVVRINESTKALINEPDIWNGSAAWIYPSVSIDARGHLGGVAFFGGGSSYPSLVTLIWDDFSAAPPPWESYFVVTSVAGDVNWGDYSTARANGVNVNTWVGTGQWKPTSTLGIANTYYVWFGRGRDQPPSNDYLVNAFFVSAGSTVFGSNVNATMEVGEPFHGSASVWWRLTTSKSGFVKIDTAGSSFDTELAVYTGSSVNALTTVAANDDCIGLQSCVRFFAVAGTTYRTAVTGFAGDTGNIQLNVSLVRTPHDFNGDSIGDVLWYNTSSGQVVNWLLNGTSIVGGGSPGSAGSPWGIVGQRDFNSDGFADILWRNGTTGQLLIWLLNGTSVIGGGSPGSAAAPWIVAGTGDFNGDGFGDVLWYNPTSGQLVIWLLNGTTVIGGGSPGSAGSPWTVAGIGDFNRDGMSDILWYNTTSGQAVIWLLNGTSIIGGGSPGSAGSPWTVAGTGDFNNDGRSDILWYNTTSGQAVIWLISGTSVIGGGSPGSAGNPWTIAQTGDFNNDGRSDILWYNSSSGQLVEWWISGATVIGGGSPGSAGSPWQIQVTNAD